MVINAKYSLACLCHRDVVGIRIYGCHASYLPPAGADLKKIDGVYILHKVLTRDLPRTGDGREDCRAVGWIQLGGKVVTHRGRKEVSVGIGVSEATKAGDH